MKQIDGATGGGQVLRLAVSLAALENTPIEIQNVRGGRETPGLRPQHVAAVTALMTLTEADSEGVSVGSETVVFEPGTPIGGDATVAIETAGSISLLFDAVLPLAIGADEPMEITAEGGTDVKWSPPIDYLRHVKLPVLRQFGLSASLEVEKRGFYPAGGGSATLSSAPSTMEPIECVDRGALEAIDLYSITSADLADAAVADRQVDGATERLQDELTVPIEAETAMAETHSTGTVILVVAEYENTRAGFSALGEPGWPAEEVGESAAESFLEFQSGPAALDVNLADQVLPFLALRGGTITTSGLTEHIKAELKILESFEYQIDVVEEQDRVRISGPNRD